MDSVKNKKDLILAAEISTKPSGFDTLLTDLNNGLANEKKRVQAMQIRLPLTFEQFCELLIFEGSILLQQKRIDRSFVIDSANESVIEQLYLYSVRSVNFRGDLDKGFMLQGKIGCGKSILLESYIRLTTRFILKFEMRVPLPLFVKSTELFNTILKSGSDGLITRPLAIDEFGRESKTAMDYGNVIRPLTELLHLRGDSGALTFGASNFSLDTLCGDEFYGKMIGDRLRVMFNFITMNGDSRRT